MSVGSFLSRILEEVFPIPHYLARRRKLLRQATAELILSEATSFNGYTTLSEEILSARLQEERQRASSMDEKTFKMTLSLSIGLTILGTASHFY
jgi:hypothetical protein